MNIFRIKIVRLKKADKINSFNFQKGKTKYMHNTQNFLKDYKNKCFKA